MPITASNASLPGRRKTSPAAGEISPMKNSLARDKVNLDIFWLRDESLKISANLPDPDVLAKEITEDLRSALAQFESLEEELGEEDGE